MHDRLRLALAALIVLAALSIPVQAAIAFGEIEITVGSEPRGNNSHGYTEYRFYVRSKSKKTRMVELAMPATGRGSGRGVLGGVVRRVEVPPEVTVTVTLLYPARPLMVGSGVAVTVDGYRFEQTLPVSPMSGSGVHHRHGGRHGAWGGHAKMAWGPGMGMNQTLVYYSQSLEEKFFVRPIVHRGGMGIGLPGGVGEAPDPGPPGGAGGPGMPGGAMGPGGGELTGGQTLNAQLFRSDIPVTAWSSDWLAYSRYDGVLVTARDLNDLATTSEQTKRVLRALHQFAETGGTLVVIGSGGLHLPKAWQRDPVRRPNAGVQTYAVGLGYVLHHPEAVSRKWREDDWLTITGALGQTNTPWQSNRPLRDLHDSFPVVDHLGVPVRGLFALMLLFAVAIGPVNLIVLSRKKKRLWMLWTVPLMSALTCAAVFGYMVVAEGWGGHARVAGITVLDQIEQRATTVGRAAYYSPLTPGDGLRFATDTEVSPLGAEHATDDTQATIEWGGEQHLRRGWVSARVPAHFALRRSEVQNTQVRLSIHREPDGRLVVVNGLGTDVKELHLADEKGALYTAGAIPAGQEATLERQGNAVVSDQGADAWRKLYTMTDWGVKDPKRPGTAAELLVPKTYLAVVEQTPFLDQGLKSAYARPAPSLVLGVFGEIGGKK